MLVRALIFNALCITAIWSRAGEPFDVSLAHSSADLSPYYRAVIREATELYRGDGPGEVITHRIRITRSVSSGIETEEITDHRGTTDLYLRSTSATGDRIVIAEVHFDPDPFPAELLSLRSTMRVATRASNQMMQLTPSRTAFTFQHD